jgi:hypothetical protein
MTNEDDLIAKILAAPQPTKVTRKKALQRDLDTWFFGGLLQELGHCSDPQCPDPRGEERVMTAVVGGKRMCRYSFMSGYGLDT